MRSKGIPLEIVIAEAAGFCFGVERSLRLVNQALARPFTPVSSLGPLIHNPQVIQGLQDRGLSVVTSAEEVESGTMIVRCHGVGPRAFEIASKNGVNIVDGTCPFVAKAQQHAAALASEGYQVIVVGERDHPEVVGIVEHAQSSVIVVEEASELPDQLSKRVGIVVQTTQAAATLSAVVADVAERCAELRVYNTICSATTERQDAAVDVARQVQRMIVVGGRNSGNTRRLVQLCRETGTDTEHIETASEVDSRWLIGIDSVGLTAGASTPRSILEEVVDRIKEIRSGQIA